MEERLFNNIKERFSQSGDDLGWNAPPDDLFSKAMDKKENKEKRKRYFYLVIPFGLLLVASVSFFFLMPSDTQNQLSETKVNSQKIEVQPSSNTILSNNESKPLPVAATKADDGKSRVINSIDSNRITNSNTSNRIAASNSVVSKKDFVVEQVRKEVLPYKPISLLSSFPLLGNIENNISYKSLLVSLQMNESTIDLFQEDSTRESVKNSTSVYFLSGINTSKLCMSGDVSPGVELTGYDSYYEGLDLELGVEFLSHKKLKPYFLLSYRRLNNSSFYSSSRDLNSDDFVHNQDGSMDYSFREMMTPMGMVDPGMEASMDHSAINEPMLYQYADINQRLDIAQLGVGLKYSFLELNKFTASISSGFSLNNFIRKNTEADLSLMDGSNKMMKESQFQGSDMDGVKNFFYTHTVGLHAEYRINNKFDLAFRFNRIGNIGSLLSYSNINTKLNSYSTQFGLSMRI